MVYADNTKLSTPHGTLGTEPLTESESLLLTDLSTPHGTLGTEKEAVLKALKRHLSTPHGTLGTPKSL